LLSRFYKPTTGSITLDGLHVRDLDLLWLRNQIGLVSQNVTLFGASIRDNIAYGHQGCTEEDIVTAAKQANAHGKFIEFD
jgi:ABC-type multidrug transport system fused ATPase/permease subunit